MSIGNEKCKAWLSLTDLNLVELQWCNGGCNSGDDLSAKTCSK